ncbi:MAG: hypothetical protein K6F88_00865, partial [Ruminococcus sp.]|nr:hypothetical protein [Ruminococcus sp.]
MKNVLKICLSALTVMLILSLSIIYCFAKGVLALDGISVGYNDTVTYTLYLADCEKPVTDMAAYLFYDSEYLELDRDSVDFHDLVGVNRNVNIDGYIPFNFSAVSSPVDFSERTPVISADFKVIKEGASSIQYFVSELDCGSSTDSSVVKEFTFTCDYVDHTVDGDEITEDAVPVILDNQEKIDEYQGGFINYADGKGEQEKSGGNHIAVKGNEIIDFTKDSDNNTTIFITAAV